MTQKIKANMISRRKALSLLGLGATLGLGLSSAMEPLGAEAQEAPATPAAPALRRHHRHQRDESPPVETSRSP